MKQEHEMTPGVLVPDDRKPSDPTAALEALVTACWGFSGESVECVYDGTHSEVVDAAEWDKFRAAVDAAEAMLDAAPAPVERVEPEPFGWFTEDYDRDKSATTYSRDVADRWVAKGWPVWPLYTTPQPAPTAAQVTTEECPHMDELHSLDKQCRDDVARSMGMTPVGDGYPWSGLLAGIKSMATRSAAQDVAGLVEALEWCEKWFSRHSPTAALISGEHATHPMLSSIRAALAAHQSGGAKL